MQDAIRQNSFFFPNEKERKFARKRGGGEKERGGGGGGRGGLTFFQRYYKLSECSCYECDASLNSISRILYFCVADYQ